MNNAVVSILGHWGLNPSDIHIIVDDVDLPLGTIRIRPKVAMAVIKVWRILSINCNQINSQGLD